MGRVLVAARKRDQHESENGDGETQVDAVSEMAKEHMNKADISRGDKMCD